MKICIFTKTCLKDLKWFEKLEASLQYIHWPYERVVVAEKECNIPGSKEPSYPTANGYLSQSLIKATTSFHYTDADYILHLDSDTRLTGPLHLDDIFSGGKPIWWITKWGGYSSTDTRWGRVADRHYLPCREYSYMRRHPFLIDARTEAETFSHIPLRELLKHCEKPIDYTDASWFSDYLAGSASFAEYELMGRVAKNLHPELYDWRVITKENHPQVDLPNFKHYHSWSEEP